MAMTSIASQLQAIKSLVQADYGTAKRPFTRPSLLFDPKEAADLDLDTIFSIGLSGLDVLLSIDEKFRNYKNDLFSHKSRELDRELLSPEENNRINASIGSFLRLISGHLHLPSAIKTLEYLIRRYKIHVYNFEDLILCALPFHDTHVFVRIVQLLDLGNSKWKFLAGVKVSGAPPPRNVIVQQCIRDMGILEVLCNYASPEKKYQPSSVVVSFCTAVLVETLGSVTTIDSDCVKRIMPFIVSGLQPSLSGSQDHKAGALMIVGLLANKVTLSPKLVKSLIGSVSEIAREDGKDSTDLQWFRLSLMALINLVQLQSVDMLPKRVVEILKERSDLAGVLLSLAKEFNIDQFLTVLLDSLADYSSDELCRLSLISILETVPLNHLVDRVVLKMLFSCMKLSEKLSNSSPESGHWAKQILVIINQKYPSELHAAVGKFFKDKKVRTKKEDLVVENLCRMLDGKMDLSLASSDSKIWFTLDHPKAEVRCAALSGLDKSSILEACDSDSHRLVVIQDAILHQLHDDDLTVIKAALSVDGLSELVNPPDLLQALNDILQWCVAILKINMQKLLPP